MSEDHAVSMDTALGRLFKLCIMDISDDNDKVTSFRIHLFVKTGGSLDDVMHVAGVVREELDAQLTEDWSKYLTDKHHEVQVDVADMFGENMTMVRLSVWVDTNDSADGVVKSAASVHKVIDETLRENYDVYYVKD